MHFHTFVCTWGSLSSRDRSVATSERMWASLHNQSDRYCSLLLSAKSLINAVFRLFKKSRLAIFWKDRRPEHVRAGTATVNQTTTGHFPLAYRKTDQLGAVEQKSSKIFARLSKAGAKMFDRSPQNDKTPKIPFSSKDFLQHEFYPVERDQPKSVYKSTWNPIDAGLK